MVIDVKRFFLADDLSDAVEYELDLSGVELDGVKPFCAPAKVQASFKSFAGSVELEARVHYTVTMPCDRCCKITKQETLCSFSHVLVRELNTSEDDDAYILVPDEKLDLDQLIREDILLNMPSKFLCRPDCQGLCPTCGKDLNEGECDCDKGYIDPRLEILKSLL